MAMVRVAGWERFGWLRHGFSVRSDGDMKGSGESRERMLGELGLERLMRVRQVHSAAVVSEGDVEADGLVGGEPGVGLGILTADCVPVLLADTRRRVVGALHAGWRGTADGIVEVGVARMVAEFGTRPEDLVGAVGPSIGACCYEVGDEFRERFAEDLFVGRKLDLWEANRRQLVAAGVGKVAVTGACTACGMEAGGGRKWFSHRAGHGEGGRLMGVIGVGKG